ncbi:MAG: hypothetical protein HY325_02230 [Chloroflexi bacterium]|nr:hypothetical protein [Chloroflexota bacterium]
MTEAKKKGKQDETQWVKDALANFETLHPGLIEKLTVMATQHQIRLSMYPQPTQGGASSSTGEQV